MGTDQAGSTQRLLGRLQLAEGHSALLPHPRGSEEATALQQGRGRGRVAVDRKAGCNVDRSRVPDEQCLRNSGHHLRYLFLPCRHYSFQTISKEQSLYKRIKLSPSARETNSAQKLGCRPGQQGLATLLQNRKLQGLSGHWNIPLSRPCGPSS